MAEDRKQMTEDGGQPFDMLRVEDSGQKTEKTGRIPLIYLQIKGCSSCHSEAQPKNLAHDGLMRLPRPHAFLRKQE